MYERITDIVDQYYDIGTVTEVCEIFGGTTNRSFGVTVHRAGCTKRFFVRLYKMGITQEEIRFEHALISHAIDRGLTACAGVIGTRQGGSFVQTADGCVFAVYDYLSGETRYTWDDSRLTDRELRNAGRFLADFHNCVYDFDPADLKRKEPPILTLWQAFPQRLSVLSQYRQESKMLSYLREHLSDILDTIAGNRFEPTADMPVIPTHYDYHPGNLKWDGDRVVGIFDFDWSKMDYRLFDVCMAAVYFCPHWREPSDGDLRLEKFSMFLSRYQQRLHTSGGLKPMSTAEIHMIPEMLAMANVYLLHWTVASYCEKATPNDDDYLAYLKHNIRLMHYVESHRSAVAATASAALAVPKTAGRPIGAGSNAKKGDLTDN